MAKDYPLDASHRLEGLWWLPASPDDKIAGTLTYEPDVGARLALIGILGDLSDMVDRLNGKDVPRTLHGMTVDGKPVTLLKAVNARANLSFPGLPAEEYLAVWTLIGGHFDDTADARFTRSETNFRGLDEWLARDALVRSYEPSSRRLTVIAEPKPRWALGRVADAAVFADMTMNWVDDRLTRTDITVLNSVGVEPDIARDLDWHIDQLLRLNRLAALCTGRHLPLRSIWLRAGEREVAPGVMAPVRVDALAVITGEREWKKEADPPIYSAAELLAANENALSRWFEVADALQPVIDLFFTVLDGGLPLEAAYLLTIQAVEVHHRRTGSPVILSGEEFDVLRKGLVAAIPEDTPAAMREKLEGALSFANEPSLGQRLRALIAQLAVDFGPTPFGFDDARVRSAVNTRNYYTHYSPKLASKASQGLDLYHLTEAFRPLLFTLLLAELNLPLADIRQHLQRRRAFSHV